LRNQEVLNIYHSVKILKTLLRRTKWLVKVKRKNNYY
jgi:hypothetical protein